jgi:hypothetical protein
MGCGNAPFEEYCKKRGIHMTGVTISEQQALYNRNNGHDVVCWNFMKFNKDFVGKYDHIIFLGSLEHLETGPVNSLEAYKRKHDKVSELFATCQQYFKESSKQKKIFLSCFHMHKDYINDWECIPLQGSMGGQYFLDEDDKNAFSAAHDAGYNIVHKSDESYAYYMATVLDPSHFGTPARFFSFSSIVTLLLSIVYPFSIYIWIYLVFGLWMWQFDGNVHFASNPEYSFGDKKNNGKVPCPLYYGVFQVK